MYQLIDGKATAKAIREEVAAEAAQISEEGSAPCLAVILVGENPASCVYVRNKHKACEEVGITSLEIRLPEETTEGELLAEIERLNHDPSVNGILVQLPLPKTISEKSIIQAISPEKDVDAFHPQNVGAMISGDPRFLPCTPAGIIELLDRYNIPVAGKECVVIGRSNIVGKPVAHLLLAKNGTVTVCHSKTADLASVTRRADILVVAIGRSKFVTADMVKEGAVVIDVGMDRDEEGKLCGDVDFASVCEKTSFITPVPGGVGPMTIAELLKNTLRAYRLQHS